MWGTGDAAAVPAVCGEGRGKQLTEAQQQMLLQRRISNPLDLSKWRDTVGIYFKKKD